MPTTNPCPHAPLPAGATRADEWDRDGTRIIGSPDQGITDSEISIWTSAFQLPDGTINADPKVLEPPMVHIYGDVDLNSDQARELAAVLLETAALLDGWVAR